MVRMHAWWYILSSSVVPLRSCLVDCISALMPFYISTRCHDVCLQPRIVQEFSSYQQNVSRRPGDTSLCAIHSMEKHRQTRCDVVSETVGPVFAQDASHALEQSQSAKVRCDVVPAGCRLFVSPRKVERLPGYPRFSVLAWEARKRLRVWIRSSRNSTSVCTTQPEA